MDIIGLGKITNQYEQYINNIYKSIDENNIKELTDLIQKNQNDEDKVKFEDILINYLVEKNCVNTIKSYKKNYKCFKGKDEFNQSLLLEAFKKDKVDIIKFLYNQDINLTSELDFNKLLEQKIKNDNIELVELLLMRNLNLKINHDNLIELHFTMYKSKDNIFNLIKLLIKRGIDINNSDGKNGFPFMMLACYNNRLDIIDYLIKKGANIDVVDSDGYTPLMYACKEGNLQLVKFLVENGANIDGENEHKDRPVTVAAYYENPEIVKYLVEKGAYIS